MTTCENRVAIVGAGLAGSEAALQLAKRGVFVDLFEMRPKTKTPVHKTSKCAELVCSNSLKSEKPQSAAGMLKCELDKLDSFLYRYAIKNRVDAGGALAVDREKFSNDITQEIQSNDHITLVNEEVLSLDKLKGYSAILLATGPMTSEKMSEYIVKNTGANSLSFFDAAAPIVESDSLDMDRLVLQDRYEDDDCASHSYLNSFMDKETYESFMNELLHAKRVMAKQFETKELFSACQPIEEIARKGFDAPRFGAMKPVGLFDPKTNKRPYAAVQLRSENSSKSAYNIVGFQTNLKFGEQKRVFSMIPGLENASFARYGVMHKNIFIDAPKLVDEHFFIKSLSDACGSRVYIAGQLLGTEGYLEAVRGGLHAAICIFAQICNIDIPKISTETVFGSLVDYATSDQTYNYQPMHVNFGIIKPLDKPQRNKQFRYEAYEKRGQIAIDRYCADLKNKGLL